MGSFAAGEALWQYCQPGSKINLNLKPNRVIESGSNLLLDALLILIGFEKKGKRFSCSPASKFVFALGYSGRAGIKPRNKANRKPFRYFKMHG